MMMNSEGTFDVSPQLIGAVYRLALAWTSTRMDYDMAQEVAANVAVNVWRLQRSDLAALQASGKLAAFVARAAENAYLSLLRSRGRRAKYEAKSAAEPRPLLPYGTSPEERYDYLRLLDAFRAAFNHIRRWDRKVFLMVAEEGKSYVATGAAFNLSPRVVEGIVLRTRMELRELMPEYRVDIGSQRSAKQHGVGR